jgi:hypothetical protein
MFNGLDLSGWKADDEQKKHWKMSDGVLRYNGKGKAGLLWTDKSYKDFELLVEFNTGGVLPTNSGMHIRGSTSLTISMPQEKEGWNRSVMRVIDDRLVFGTYGKPLNKPAQKKGIPETGPLGFWADEPVQIRNVFIRELKKDEK